jgi:hypothetical protein
MTNLDIWNTLNEDDRNTVMKLLVNHQRVDAIRYTRSAAGLGIIESRDFVDSSWLLQRVISFDPTRMTQLQEFKAKILRIANEALLYAAEMECIDDAVEATSDSTKDSLAEILEVCLED